MKNKSINNKNQYNLKRKALVSSVLFAISGMGQSANIQLGNNCSLVEAIEAANTDAVVNNCTSGNGDDIIQLSNSADAGVSSQHESSLAVPGTYVGLPIISSHITIEGQGQTIRGSNTVNPFRIFELASGSTLVLNDVTVDGGNDGLGFGSGVLNYGGSLVANNSTFSNNHGAVASIYGQTSINDSVVVSNYTSNSAAAAGIFVYSSYFELNNSSVINNRLSEIPPLWGQRSSKGKIDIKGGGSGPVAGGIQLINSESKLINSTISGNKGFIGGLAITEEASSLISKHLKKGKNPNKGGPSYSTLISHVTLSDNTGYIGGFAMVANLGSLTLEGSIITGNKTEVLPEYANGYIIGASSVTTDAHNFIGDNGQTKVYGLPMGPSDVVFTNSASDNLYPLNLTNGQFVQPLKHGSVAIDGLAKSCYQNVAVDQEGKGRGIDGDSNGSFICDAGAFEHSLPILVNGGSCTLQNALLSANSDGSVGGCQPGNGHDIIELPQGSTYTSTQAVESYESVNNPLFNRESGLPVIRSSMVINGNGSTIERDSAAVEDFGLIDISNGNGLILNDTTVTGVNAGIAAVAGWYGSEIQIFNSQITGNQSVGVLSVFNHISGIENSVLSGNTGSSDPTLQTFGAAMIVSTSHNFRVKNNLITNNVGAYYGGLQIVGCQNMVVSNNTISNNEGGYVGGMVISQNQGLITHNTITQNSGSTTGGVLAPYIIDLKLSHNIISGNIQVVAPPDERGGVSTSDMLVTNTPGNFLTRHNIFGQSGVSETDGFVLDPTDMVPAGSVSTVIDDALAANGGDTMSHILVPGSIAIDAGDGTCELNAVDQRGFIRPWDGDADGSAACDIGAIEVNSVHEDDLIFKDGFEDDSGVI